MDGSRDLEGFGEENNLMFSSVLSREFEEILLGSVCRKILFFFFSKNRKNNGIYN